jgi:hypothetical protein
MAWLRRIAQNGVDYFSTVRPLGLAVGILIFALTLVALSAVVGVYSSPLGQKATGYGLALNWTFGFTLVAPFFAFFLLISYQSVPDLITRLVQADMLGVREKPAPMSAGAAGLGRWTVARHRTAPWWLGVTIIGVLASTWEWYAYSGGPLLVGRAVQENEIDWSVLLRGADLDHRIVGAAFSFAVFIQQMFLISLIGLMLHFALALSTFVQDLRARGRSVRLVPSTGFEPDDTRRGFQLFSEVFGYFLVANLCLYAHLLLSRLWNAYLHDQRATSIWHFLWTGIDAGIKAMRETSVTNPTPLVNEVLKQLTDLGPSDFSGLVVSLATFLSLAIALCLLAVVLRGAAKSGQAELLAGTLSGTGRKRIEAMSFWPLKFPGLGTLIALGFLATVGMLSHKAATVFLGAAFLVALTGAISRVLRKA